MDEVVPLIITKSKQSLSLKETHKILKQFTSKASEGLSGSSSKQHHRDVSAVPEEIVDKLSLMVKAMKEDMANVESKQVEKSISATKRRRSDSFESPSAEGTSSIPKEKKSSHKKDKKKKKSENVEE